MFSARRIRTAIFKAGGVPKVLDATKITYQEHKADLLRRKHKLEISLKRVIDENVLQGNKQTIKDIEKTLMAIESIPH